MQPVPRHARTPGHLSEHQLKRKQRGCSVTKSAPPYSPTHIEKSNHMMIVYTLKLIYIISSWLALNLGILIHWCCWCYFVRGKNWARKLGYEDQRKVPIEIGRWGWWGESKGDDWKFEHYLLNQSKTMGAPCWKAIWQLYVHVLLDHEPVYERTGLFT